MSASSSAPPARVLILGGGPTGLYAARTLAAQGHRVTLLEKESRAGGLAIAFNHNPKNVINPLIIKISIPNLNP